MPSSVTLGKSDEKASSEEGQIFNCFDPIQEEGYNDTLINQIGRGQSEQSDD